MIGFFEFGVGFLQLQRVNAQVAHQTSVFNRCRRRLSQRFNNGQILVIKLALNFVDQLQHPDHPPRDEQWHRHHIERRQPCRLINAAIKTRVFSHIVHPHRFAVLRYPADQPMPCRDFYINQFLGTGSHHRFENQRRCFIEQSDRAGIGAQHTHRLFEDRLGHRVKFQRRGHRARRIIERAQLLSAAHQLRLAHLLIRNIGDHNDIAEIIFRRRDSHPQDR